VQILIPRTTRHDCEGAGDGDGAAVGDEGAGEGEEDVAGDEDAGGEDVGAVVAGEDGWPGSGEA
jgi:hypothetical protein